MKTLLSSLHRIVPATAWLLCGLTTKAVTFTSDTAITFDNTNYDGLDIVITNCTVTVDGPHSFASLQVLNAGRLTHSYTTNGLIEDRRTVTNEPHVLSATHPAKLASTNVVASSIVVRDVTGLVTYTEGVDYVTGPDSNGITTLLLTAYSAIAEGSMNLVTYSVLYPSIAAGLGLTVVGDVTVAQGGAINADGKGYGGGLGYGAGRWSGSPLSGSGAGHGGYGGQSVALDGFGQTYDAIQEPTGLGSGGGNGYGGVGGAGGGSINLVVGGNVRVDGSVSANGANGVNERSGGGSGGSIRVSAQSFIGTGLISANGGAGEPSQGGGGGGGRISLEYQANTFSGLIAARGGSGYIRGGAGTIYTRCNTQATGQVLVDNGGKGGADTPLSTSEAVDLSAQSGGVVSLPGPRTIGNLLVGSNAWLNLANQSLTVTNNATVQAGGGINADGGGNPGNQGTGSGKYATSGYGFTGGGGGFGGFGAAGGGTNAYGGATYGSATEPADLGSGGGGYPAYGLGGAGGGAIRLNVRGMLLCDGRISADGSPGIGEGSGGGSGGSIWLTVGTLAGAGTISANGGFGNGSGLWGGGGGGGGRIAIQYGMNLFFGTTSARGSSGAAWGGAGTIFVKANNQSLGQVLADNGGQAGTNTTLGAKSPGAVDLTVRGGAVVSPPSSQTIGTLLVASGGWLSVSNQSLTVTGNVTIQPGGGIIADGKGYPAGTGSGAGRYASTPYSGYIGGGAGYGGYGAAGGSPSSYPAYGGNTYGSVTTPTDLGSGGGTYSTYAVGGAGGGAVRLTVSGLLQVDGRISAAGGPGITPSGGGGSGGSIWLTVGTLAGSGSISADGGAGNFLGGGGGGGRIAVLYAANAFSGVMSAYGGGGYTNGGAGTVYTKANSQSWGVVTLDNGGQSGTNTSLSGLGGSMDLTIKGGAVVPIAYLYGFPTLRTLLVASNGWVVVSASQGYPGQGTMTVTGDATVQAGGGILADGAGYGGGVGTGAGRYAYSGPVYVGGGGGYGGYGAASGGSLAAAGGNTYGLVTEPSSPGSGGGTSLPSLVGGAGGGAFRMNVTGTLRVDGRISAAGAPGASANAGGGSGGSIWLTAGTLLGTGIVSANGGMGIGLGGGGGGGRIAFQYGANAFSGSVSACGGGGYAWGGAGTIYSRANNRAWGQVIVDNRGQTGTNTSWTSSGTVDLTVAGGAVVAPPTSQTFGTLLVASNGWISASNHVLTVTSNATIQAGGGIIAEGTGYAGGQGPGAGTYTSSPYLVGGGGGYGGNGATSGGTRPAVGGSTYGSMTAPVDRGSGGGGPVPLSPGGSGGGAVRLNVTGALLINGRISANGGAGIGQGAGGGSGGSVWLTAGSLAGGGIISANGGAGNELGGGGGGGCVSLQYGVNAFEGTVSACGGGGYAWGGAGTIYTKATAQAMGQLLVDNGGRLGTNTPIPYLSPFDLTIRGGAVAYPSSQYLLLSNLYVSAGGVLTGLASRTNLDVAVLRNATIDVGGVMTVDGLGFARNSGAGAGRSANSIGSGAGYGGQGGASSQLPGGQTYGAAQQPVDRGSGGGFGYGAPGAGSEGGGAIRLNVGSLLTVNGWLSASGNPGLQDDSGGGSGGSLWLTAGALVGSGVIAADGGAGELYQGGGGGGGRIAIYTPVNLFGGLVSAAGGAGYMPGQTGSVYYAASAAAPQVVSCTPVGASAAVISNALLVFSLPVNPYSVAAPNIGLTAPGLVAVSNLAVTALSPCCYQIGFPAQTAKGSYTLTVGPQIVDLTGQPMSSAYTGCFSIVWAEVHGAITDANGLPVPGVVLQPDGGVPAATTDTSGEYSLELPPAGIVTVLPAKAGLMFVPTSRSYTNTTTAIWNQNYAAVGTVAPGLTSRVQANNYVLSWYGIAGVTYQPLCSTNLVDWWPCNDALPGTNGPLQLVVPVDTSPILFFRVGASY